MKPTQTIQYLCGSCNIILKEFERLIDPETISEPCPNCGNSLSSTLMVSRPRRQVEQVTFQTAKVEILTFDVKVLDDFYHGIRLGDIFCMTGRVGSLIGRLCVRSLLPLRLGGLGSSVLIIDAGNTSDLYQCVSFARQYGIDVSKVLKGIVVSRAFTIHQLASLVINELAEAVRCFGARLVVVSGLLTMFLQDPLVDIHEARRLLRQITTTIEKIANAAIVISAHEICGYEDILAKLQNRIDVSGSDALHVKLSSPYRSREFVLQERVFAVAGE